MIPSIYYVDAIRGDDSRDGSSLENAWRTLARCAGISGTIRMAKGSIWAEPIQVHPWTRYEAFGHGNIPVIGVGTAVAVYARKVANVSLDGLALNDVTDRHIDISGCDNWNISNCQFSRNGAGRQALYGVNSDNLIVQGCKINDINGDGVYLSNCAYSSIIDCDISYISGPDADGIQIRADRECDGLVIRNNKINMSTGNTKKGSIAVGRVSNIIVEGNDLVGGNYGVALAGNRNVVTKGNNIRDCRLQSYSWGIGIGEKWDVSDYLIEENIVERCRRGLMSSGIGGSPNGGPNRFNFDIRRNIIRQCDIGLYIDRPTSGNVSHNKFISCGQSTLIRSIVSPRLEP